MDINTHELSHVDVHRRDSKGRIDARELTDRELLEEAVTSLRSTADMVTDFIEGMSKNPVLGTMAKMFGR